MKPDDEWKIKLNLYWDGGNLQTTLSNLLSDDHLFPNQIFFQWGSTHLFILKETLTKVVMGYWDNDQKTFLGRPTLHEEVLWERPT